MRSTFFGLEIGRLGLQAHQAAQNVTFHNMANASTPGYSRQRAELTTTQPYTYPAFNRSQSAGQLGTGVEATAIMRIRDELIDKQIWRETTTMGYWESRYKYLDQIELIFNEPAAEELGEGSLRTYVNAFWTALQNWAEDSTFEAPRTVLREATITMTQEIRYIYTSLNSLRQNINEQIKQEVANINTIASKIAQLNEQIGKITALNDHANDLMDQRDLLVEELSKKLKIDYTFDQFNRMTITAQGIPLVQGVTANRIITEPNYDDLGMVSLRWSMLDKEVDIRGGTLKGLFEMRDQDIPYYLDQLNQFASTLITEVNKIHREGYDLDGNTGIDFFSGTNAVDIDLSDAIKDLDNGLNRIAAAKSIDGLPGDNSNIEELYGLFSARLLSNGHATFGEFIGAMVADLGERSSTAKLKYDGQYLLINELDRRRESVCGVSLDEEMADMVRFQHGYNAASKIIATMDEMLDVIIYGLKV